MVWGVESTGAGWRYVGGSTEVDWRPVKGWMTRQIFLAHQNQHVSKPT